MVRTGHALINNSAVVGRSFSLNEGQLADIESELAKICSSVEGHSGRMGNGDNDTPDDASDDVSMIAATMCRNAKATVVLDTVDTNGARPGT